MTAAGSRVGTAGSRVAAAGSKAGIAGSRVSSRVGPQSTFATAGATLPSTDLSLPDYLCNPVSLLSGKPYRNDNYSLLADGKQYRKGVYIDKFNN